jgi:hypothetical protein
MNSAPRSPLLLILLLGARAPCLLAQVFRQVPLQAVELGQLSIDDELDDRRLRFETEGVSKVLEAEPIAGFERHSLRTLLEQREQKQQRAIAGRFQPPADRAGNRPA